MKKSVEILGLPIISITEGRDSLQIRYDALCGTVRIIHQRQQE